MTDRKMLCSAITAAMLAVVIAVPFQATGQSTTSFTASIPPRDYYRSAVASPVRNCLRFGLCPTAGGGNVLPGRPKTVWKSRTSRPPDDLQPDAPGVDRKVLLSIRNWDAMPARLLFGAADASAYPAFVAAPVALWGGAFADRVPRDDAIAGTVALAAGFGTAMLLKRLVARPRPYAVIDGLSPRSGYAGSVGLSDTASFPSGHATLAGLIATGAALLARHPAVTAGSVVWAGSVSVSRVWLGVHYPSDVAAGLILGSGASILGYSILR